MLSSVSGIQATDIVSGSKQGTGSKVATSGTVTASRCAEWDANGTLVSAAGGCGKAVVAGSNISLTDNGTTVTVSATPAAGSVTSTNGASVDGELALFSGTSGTQIKRATGSGFLKATSGVLSSVSGIQATDIVSGSKQGAGSKVATSGTVTANRCAEWDANGTLVSAAGACNSASACSEWLVRAIGYTSRYTGNGDSPLAQQMIFGPCGLQCRFPWRLAASGSMSPWLHRWQAANFALQCMTGLVSCSHKPIRLRIAVQQAETLIQPGTNTLHLPQQ